MAIIGIIGGSGLDDPDILKNPREIEADTPYGRPSSSIKSGQIAGKDTLIIARHGRNHELSPAQVNNQANIHALKEAGATHILATTACGSLREQIDRGHFIILDQFIDLTRLRKNTFFESFEGGINHTVMAHPFDETLGALLFESAKTLGFPAHPKGTVITIEGPRFSTVAESKMFRAWGADVINMSTAPETALANEAGIPYAAVAMSTDFDCWKEDEEVVSWQEILAVFERNAENVKQLLIKTIENLKE